MNNLKPFGLAFIAVFALSALIATSAYAESGWGKCVERSGGLYKDSLCNEQTGGEFEFDDFETTKSVSIEGTMTIEDSSFKVKVECHVTQEGTVGPGASDEITKDTTTSCKSISGCEGVTSVTAAGLPWKTNLETVGTEIRDEISPDWTVECTVLGIKFKDTCSGETTAGIKDVSAGVESAFESASPNIDCTLGGTEKGVLGGSTTFKNPIGTQLVVKGPGRLIVKVPNPPSLSFLNKNEVLEIEIEYAGLTNSGNLKVAVVNDTESGAYVEKAGGNCAGKSWLDGQTCKIRIELAGNVGAGGHVDVMPGARLVLGAHVVMN